MGFSQSKCHAKGFTKSEKIEEIKKHYYSSQISPKLSPIQADPKAKQQASITTFPIPPCMATSNEKSHTQTVRVLPCGGSLYGSTQSLIKLLKNTCPIDNYLTLMYVLMSDHKNFNDYFASSSDAECLL